MAMRLVVFMALIMGFGVAPAQGHGADIVEELGRVLDEELELAEEADVDPAEARLLADENATETATGTSTETATGTATATSTTTGTATVTDTTTEDDVDPSDNTTTVTSTATPTATATTSATATATSTTTVDPALQVTGSLTMSGMTQAQAEAFQAPGDAQNAVIKAIATKAGVSENAVEAGFTMTQTGGRRLGERRLSGWQVEVAYTITFASSADAQAAQTALDGVTGATWAAAIESELTAAGLSGYSIGVTPSVEPTPTNTVTSTSTTVSDTTTAGLEEPGSGAAPSAKAVVSVAVALVSLLVPSLL